MRKEANQRTKIGTPTKKLSVTQIPLPSSTMEEISMQQLLGSEKEGAKKKKQEREREWNGMDIVLPSRLLYKSIGANFSFFMSIFELSCCLALYVFFIESK